MSSGSTAESAVGRSYYGEVLTTSAIVAEAVTGSHVLQIKGYSLTKGLGNCKFINSSTFSIGGHSWRIPDGNILGNTDWISIYLQLDHTDAVDVEARFRFSVLDDVGESVPMFSQESSTTITFSSKSSCYGGFLEFVGSKALENSSYLKDDCLKVKCDVTVSKDISSSFQINLRGPYPVPI